MDRKRTTNAFIGSPVERIEDLRFLRGRGEYVDDVTRDDLLHAAILRSAVAHGRIRSIDTARGAARPGVHAVITAADIGDPVPTIPLRQEPLPAFKRFEQPVIADRKVRYVGEPIAVVMADSAGAAEDALEAIELDIEPLPAVADRDSGAPRRRCSLFEEAGTNLASTLTACAATPKPRSRPRPIRGASASRSSATPRCRWSRAGSWPNGTRRGQSSPCTAPPRCRSPTAAFWRSSWACPKQSIRMVENDVGGGFGVRGEFYPEDFLIPFAARLIGRPVKWIEDRREHLLATNHARDVECELEIACDRDGTILALRGHAYADLGAYMRTNGADRRAQRRADSLRPLSHPEYRIDVVAAGDQQDAGRDLSRAGAVRGGFLPRAAVRHGRGRSRHRSRRVPPAQSVRRSRDAVCARHRRCRSTSRPRPTAATITMTLDRCLAEFDWAAKTALQGKLIDGRYHGIAVGCYIEGGASGPRENARLVLEDRRHGLGLCRLVGDRPGTRDGVRADRRRRARDADGAHQGRVPRLDRPSARRLRLLQLALGGDGRLRHRRGGGEAARRNPPRRRRSARLRARTTSRSTRGSARSVRAGRSLPFGEFAGLSATAAFASNKRTYSYGAHAAHVAVDPKTGHVESRLRGGRGRRPHHQSAHAARPDGRRDRAGSRRRAPRASRLRRRTGSC